MPLLELDVGEHWIRAVAGHSGKLRINSHAKDIVESSFQDFMVELPQRSHFFRNLTFFVGYFTVHRFKDEGFID
jgi:hypothetical protein